ncbi:hypothetical protein HPP92_001128 [Vanilla planifolia]|uniref:Mitochondrial import inner membrane translocase subunit n=1 Tax=Vanilla planifolia TaxID=51239 RepID=A0A835VLK0_VANPL|nr:hypothetical protein HPP92_001128 [Vanilla planifolia]
MENSDELQRFLEQEKQKALISEMVGKLDNICWDNASLETLAAKFSSTETTCLTNCAQRYMDMSIIIMKHFRRCRMPSPVVV